jgi:substrate import-associated zinc metallohydrolase lipoprotein
LFSFYSCEKEDELRDESVVIFDKSNQNDLDKWIYENLTKPYNVKVKYKWDDSEIFNGFHVVPPKMEKAEEFLKAYLNLWIKSYEEESIVGGDPDFIYKLMPKLLVLVGSPQFNADGTMTLGLAEGGKKVTIFNIDAFANVILYPDDTPEALNRRKRESIIKSFHTLHHEFAHILHQTKFYPEEFKEISKGLYTGNWMDINDVDANKKGFITAYSMSMENEDFVEIAASILSKSANTIVPKLYTNMPLKNNDGFLMTQKVNMYLSDWEYAIYYWGWELDWSSYPYEWMITPETQASWIKFNQKVDIVTTYYKEKWGIDLYEMQKRIDIAAIKLYNVTE